MLTQQGFRQSLMMHPRLAFSAGPIHDSCRSNSLFMKKFFLNPLLAGLLLVAAACGSAPTSNLEAVTEDGADVEATTEADTAAEDAKVETFTSETGGFTIDSPLDLIEASQSVPTAAGDIDIYTYTAENDNAAYVVAYSDYPAEIVEQTDPAMILDGGRDGAVGNVGGTLVSEDQIELDGNPGRSLVIDAETDDGQAATINARIYLVENRLYQALVVVPKDGEDKVDIQGFLDSFTLTE
jgi:hypothetical protein